MNLLWNVIERHFDEAEFLFEVWAGCLESPDYGLEELAAGPEARVFAHLDGLALAGAPIIDQPIMPTFVCESSDTSRTRVATLNPWRLVVSAKPSVCA